MPTRFTITGTSKPLSTKHSVSESYSTLFHTFAMASPIVLPSLLSAQVNSNVTQRFPGLQERCREFSQQDFDFADAVMDDMDGEQETMAVRTDSDAVDGEVQGERFLDEEGKEGVLEDITMADPESSFKPVALSLTDMDSTGLQSILKEASKGISEGTHGEYKRYSLNQ
jgi:hypothetical protein